MEGDLKDQIMGVEKDLIKVGAKRDLCERLSDRAKSRGSSDAPAETFSWHQSEGKTMCRTRDARTEMTGPEPMSGHGPGEKVGKHGLSRIFKQAGVIWARRTSCTVK